MNAGKRGKWNRNDPEAGFSLLELLILIAILLFTGQMIVNHMTSPLRSAEAHRVSQVFQQKLNWAMQYAESHQTMVDFWVADGEHRLVILAMPLGSEPKRIDSYSYPKWLTIRDNVDHRIRIYADGSVNQGGTFTLEAGGKEIIKLSLQIYTGSIHEKRL